VVKKGGLWAGMTSSMIPSLTYSAFR
jgi:hypothetical protein